MIQNFNQFISEATNGTKTQLSTLDAINEPFSNFINRAQERFNNTTSHIIYLINQMDKAIESIMTEMDDVIVGEPIIDVAPDLHKITVTINTNVPFHDEDMEDDESVGEQLDYRLIDVIDKKEFEDIDGEVQFISNEDGNYPIELRMYVIDSDQLGNLTDALYTFGK